MDKTTRNIGVLFPEGEMSTTYASKEVYCLAYRLQRHREPPIKSDRWGFPGGAVVENLPTNAGDTGSSPGLGRSHMPWSD